MVDNNERKREKGKEKGGGGLGMPVWTLRPLIVVTTLQVTNK